MRVLVCGGRQYKDRDRVFATLDQMLKLHGAIEIIEGGASGADTFAREWAKDRNQKEPETYRADWHDLATTPVVIRVDQYGRRYNAAAGAIRNKRMRDEGKPEVVIAFPGGTGTRNMVKLASEAGLPVVTVG